MRAESLIADAADRRYGRLNCDEQDLTDAADFTFVTTEQESRRAAAALCGERLAGVTYLGNTYDEDPSSRRGWDFRDWHAADLAVEVITSSGNPFHITGEQMHIEGTNAWEFELAFKEGPHHSGWPRMIVTDHPRWTALLGTPLLSCELVVSIREWNPVKVKLPLALRLATETGVAWITTGMPAEPWNPDEELNTGNANLGGYDDIIVLFDDESAQRIGLAVVG